MTSSLTKGLRWTLLVVEERPLASEVEVIRMMSPYFFCGNLELIYSSTEKARLKSTRTVYLLSKPTATETDRT